MDIQTFTDEQLARVFGARQTDITDYVHEHRHMAEQVIANNGGLIDLDCMVELEEVLGEPVDWALYRHIDSLYDQCILEVLDRSDKTAVENEIRQRANEKLREDL